MAPGPNQNTQPGAANPSVTPAPAQVADDARQSTEKGERYEEIKSKVHSLLVDNLNLDPTKEVDREDVKAAAGQILENVLTSERIPMSRTERESAYSGIGRGNLGAGSFRATPWGSQYLGYFGERA